MEIQLQAGLSVSPNQRNIGAGCWLHSTISPANAVNSRTIAGWALVLRIVSIQFLITRKFSYHDDENLFW